MKPPLIVPCSCGQTLRFEHDDLRFLLVVRHGDGEARRAWTYQELADAPSDELLYAEIDAWIDGIHIYESANRDQERA